MSESILIFEIRLYCSNIDWRSFLKGEYQIPVQFNIKAALNRPALTDFLMLLTAQKPGVLMCIDQCLWKSQCIHHRLGAIIPAIIREILLIEFDERKWWREITIVYSQRDKSPKTRETCKPCSVTWGWIYLHTLQLLALNYLNEHVNWHSSALMWGWTCSAWSAKRPTFADLG